MFYKDLIKKIKEKKIENIKDINKYGINIRQMVMLIGTSIPMLTIGLLHIYMSFVENKNDKNFKIIISIFIIILGIIQLKRAFSYKIILDLNENIIKYPNLTIKFSEISEIKLRLMIPPGMKRFEASLDIITKEREQFIIPLVMHKKIEFVAVLKEKLSDKFYIDEKI